MTKNTNVCAHCGTVHQKNPRSNSKYCSLTRMVYKRYPNRMEAAKFVEQNREVDNVKLAEMFDLTRQQAKIIIDRHRINEEVYFNPKDYAIVYGG